MAHAWRDGDDGGRGNGRSKAGGAGPTRARRVPRRGEAHPSGRQRGKAANGQRRRKRPAEGGPAEGNRPGEGRNRRRRVMGRSWRDESRNGSPEEADCGGRRRASLGVAAVMEERG
jgi:hypothetical protein